MLLSALAPWVPTLAIAQPAETHEPAVATAGQLTRAPELLRFAEAEIDESSAASPLTQQGAVLLALTVAADGTVSEVTVERSLDPARDAAARSAALTFVFRPAEVDGKPAAVVIQYEYVFRPTPPTIESPPPPPPPLPPLPPLPAVPTGQLKGQLLEQGTRKPLLGARVQLPAFGLETLTDGEGRFSFHRVEAGQVQLVLSDTDHGTIEDTERVTAGAVTELVYYAEATGFGQDDLVAVGRKVQKQVVRREISIKELETVPGSNGDALKAVQNLPGVARTNGDQLVLRGVQRSQVLVNGHPLPFAFHFGGLRSTVANGMIESLQVTPGNYDARYGATNGGVIDIQTGRPATDGLHGYGQVDLFDASVFLEGPVGDHGAFALGARRSYIDGVLAVALSEEDKETFPSAPRYYDFQGTYDWQKGNNRLRFIGLGSSDRMVLLFDEPVENDPALRGNLNLSERWATLQALWDHRANEDTQLSLGLSYLWADSRQGLGEEFRLEFTNHQFTARADLSHRLAPWITARAGLHANVWRSDFDVFIPQPPKEGQPDPILSTQTGLLAAGTAAEYRPAAYVAADITLGPVLLVPALRVDHFSRVNELGGTAVVQPRLDARVRVTPTTTAKAGVGLFSSPPEIDESNAVFGNPQIEPELSRHYSLGVEQRLGDALSLDVTGFYQDLHHLIAPVDDPRVKYNNGGSGRVYGAELLLKHDARSRFYGWVAYTLMRSERKGPGETDYRIFDLDQTHNLNIVGQYRLSHTWEVGARFRAITGDPTTPVIDAVYDSDADTFSPIYGATNSQRQGTFHQLDVRVDKHWIFDTWKLTGYLDLQNIYNRKNPETTSYNYNYRESKAAAGLPFIPSFGIKGEF